MARYYNYDYEKKEYFEVGYAYHDHYTFNAEKNAWYEIIYPEVDPDLAETVTLIRRKYEEEKEL